MKKKKSLPPLDKDVLKTLSSDSRSQYSPTQHPAILQRLAGAGLSDTQIAGFLGISPETLTSWRNKYQVARRALETARIERDLKVVDALYNCAIGYEHVYEEGRETDDGTVILPRSKHLPPDVRAQEIWLFNRMPDQWKSKTNIELTGRNGGPVEHVNMSPEQAVEVLASMGLRRAASQLESKEVVEDDNGADE